MLPSVYLYGCLGGLAIHSHTANVAYSDTLVVVACYVGALLGLRSPLLHRAVQKNDIVITYTAPSLCLVPAVYVSSREVLAFCRSRTMHYNISYLFQFCHDF